METDLSQAPCARDTVSAGPVESAVSGHDAGLPDEAVMDYLVL